jgi:oligosaccharide repeat unit polymerase
MESQSLAIIFFGFLFYLITVFKSNKFSNPAGLIILLWCLLLFISSLSTTGIIPPSNEAIFLILLAMASIAVGSFFFTYSPTNKNIVNKSSKGTENILFFLLLFFSFPPFMYALFVSIKFIFNEGYYSFLAQTRWVEDSDTTLAFGGKLNKSIINYIAMPISYAAFFIGLSLYLTENRKKVFFISSLLLLLHSFLLTARHSFILIIFSLIIGLIIINAISSLNSKSHLKSIIKFSFISIIILIVLTFALSLSRSDLPIKTLLSHYFINYHTVGFTLFDIGVFKTQEINHTYGLSTFSFLGLFYEKSMALLYDESVFSSVRELRYEMNKNVLLGYQSWKEGGKYFGNAFYTALYVFYVDFNIIGIIIFPFIYGLILMRNYLLFIYHKHLTNLTFTIFFTYVGYNSLFMPMIINEPFWITLLIMYLILNLRIKVLKKLTLTDNKSKSQVNI